MSGGGDGTGQIAVAPEIVGGTPDDILDRLSLIGQDITASLEFDDIFAAVERHVGVLLDAATFYIGILDDAFTWVDVPLFVDGGVRSTSRRFQVGDPARPACRAVRENREILHEKTLDEAIRTDIPGTTLTLSALFRPLVVRGRMIGVMSVQSVRAHAYGHRERLIFRTLCSYVAVALANGASFSRLAAAEADRLRSLTTLVAGIAHEVNTPVGTALTVASTFGVAAEAFRGRVETGSLRRSDLLAFVDKGIELARQVSTNLTRAGDLVRQFKTVGLDRASETPRLFRLRELVGSVLTGLDHDIATRPHRIEIAIPDGLELASYSESLHDVLTSLVRNALLHAFRPGREGTIRIEAAAAPGREVRISVADDGIGLSDSDRQRIFEPFSTAPGGSRGSGLGLHIAYNVVTKVLGGHLACRSIPGHGSTFSLGLPADVSTAAKGPQAT